MVGLLTLAATAVFTATAHGQAPESDSRPAISVFMDFDSRPAPESVEVMKREVEELLKPSGIKLNWHTARETASGPDAGFVVLKFKGKCRVENWAQPGSDFGTLGEVRTLGQTIVDHGRVLPFSEVECDQVRKGLAYAAPAQSHSALGLAMGRVVAHELYHILAHTTAHARRGLAQPGLASERSVDLGVEAGVAVGAPPLGRGPGRGVGGRRRGRAAGAGAEGRHVVRGRDALRVGAAAEQQQHGARHHGSQGRQGGQRPQGGAARVTRHRRVAIVFGQRAHGLRPPRPRVAGPRRWQPCAR